MAFRWRADDGPALNPDFKEIRASIAKEPYIFEIFQGAPDPLSPHWIRTCKGIHIRVLPECSCVLELYKKMSKRDKMRGFAEFITIWTVDLEIRLTVAFVS